jgi:hypothetical protein
MSDISEVRKLLKKSPVPTAKLLFAGVPKAAKKKIILELQKQIKNRNKVCFSYKDGGNARGFYLNSGPAEYVLGCKPKWRFEDPEDSSVHHRSAKRGKVTCGNCLRSKAY